MRKAITVIAEICSLFLAVGIWIFFNGYPGYTPSGENGLLFGIGTVFLIAVIYAVIEVAAVLKAATPSPLYFAFETFISYTPLFAFAMVVQRWLDGHIVVSSFQMLAGSVVLVAVLLDVLGFVSMLAQRYLLTDELKSVQ